MRIRYDRETDTLVFTFRDEAIVESDELAPGLIADLDAKGTILRLELLQASTLVDKADEVRFETTR